jgi:uncharacterized protein YecT (DUF1311 family)
VNFARIFRLPCRRLLALVAALVFTLSARALDWPKGYEIADDTDSPDGHYSILAPGRDAADEEAGNNFLVDPKAHKVLGKIVNASYLPGRSRQGVSANWSDDSRQCVVQFDERDGIYSVAILETKGESLRQYDVSSKMKEVLSTAMYGKKNGKAALQMASNYGPGTQIRFRALADSDPRRHADSQTVGYFWGTFDTATGKWVATEARKADAELADCFFAVFNAADDEDYAKYSAENNGDNLERDLNGTYHALKMMLPADKFAALKKEQIEWLKKRDAIPAGEERTKFVIARVNALRALLW